MTATDPVTMICFLMLVMAGACLAGPHYKAAIRTTRASYCSQYSKITPSHTMCKEDVGTDEPLTEREKQAAVDLHNQLRAKVRPSAANMLKMVWDEDIAKVAAKWARQCIVGHDEGKERMVPSRPGVYIGQNFGAGYDDLQKCINSWHNEKKDFRYGKGAKQKGKLIGHYTQVVSSGSIRIGCGEAHCPNSDYKSFYVCNYAVGQGDMLKPYKRGSSCSACPGNCNNKLCDCRGLLCYNGGSLDSKTCSCKCKPMYSGDQCEVSACKDKVCLNGGTLDSNTCKCQCKPTHTGINCQTKANPSSSDCPEPDKRMCNTDMADQWGCGDFLKKTCPIKCHVCTAPNGCTTRCKNGGILTPSCTCDCLKDYTGDTCETLACSSSHPSTMCAHHTAADCEKYLGLKEICPSLCGLCP